MRYRYRSEEELKDSGVEWIGKIPKDWEIIKLKHKCTFLNGYAFKSEDLDINNDVPVVRIGDINENGIDLYKILKVKKDLTQSLDLYEIKKGNTLIAMSGATVGKAMFMLKSNGELINQRVGIIRPKNINQKYLHYSINNTKFKNEILISSVGGAQENISSENIKDKHTMKFDIKEQEKIANFLDEKTSQFDLIISKKEKLIESLEEAKKSLISEVVTGKVKVVKSDEGYELVKRKSDEMKDSGVEWLGDIPKDWEVKKFKYIFSLNKGLSITKVDLKEEGIPCVNYGEIHSRYRFELKPSIHKLKYVDELYLKYNTTSLLSYGDFIFCDTSEDIDGCGNFTCLNENSSIFAGYHTIIAKALKQINFRYMSYLFDSNSWRIQIRTRVSGVKVFSITQTILKETNIIMPYLLEQENIVKYLDVKCNEINSSICKIKLQIEKLKEAKQSLISEAVTGKIEILD